jgi:hypothetical protein
MAKHHITHKEPKWGFGLVVNGLGAVVSAIVCVVIAATKFHEAVPVSQEFFASPWVGASGPAIIWA